MKSDSVRALLETSLLELANARKHLDYSFQQVAGLPDSLAGLLMPTDGRRMKHKSGK